MASQEALHFDKPPVIGNLKCAEGNHNLNDPVQLPACLHILCKSCINGLKSGDGFCSNIHCPKCGQENAPPDVLKRISGVNESVASESDIMLCDNCLIMRPANPDPAGWNCFNCGVNMCGLCRAVHSRDPQNRDHRITLLVHPVNLNLNQIDSTSNAICQPSVALTSPAADETDTYVDTAGQCPVCGSTSCTHAELLAKMTDRQRGVDACPVEGHVESCSGRRLERKFFCKRKQCWKPVCGDCAQKGEHKLHDTSDLSKLGGEYVNPSLAKHLERLNILLGICMQEIKDENDKEDALCQHVQSVADEMTHRKIEILEKTTQAFERAVGLAKEEGQKILDIYKRKQRKMYYYKELLKKVEDGIHNISIGDHFDAATYISAFERQNFAANLIGQIESELLTLEKPLEYRLALLDVKSLSIPPHPLARVSRERCQLQKLFDFQLKGEFSLVYSIVVLDGDKCLLSCRRSLTQDDDAISLCHFDMERGRAHFTEFDVERGRYLISRLKSGEIVASYASKHESPKYSVMYCDGKEFSQMRDGTRVQFSEIAPFSFPPCGIATTSDNNILVCCNADEKKGLSYLMLMSMQGKKIEDTVTTAEKDMISPNYVAVSENGEICACDTEGSSVYILDSELKIKERMNYKLPSSLKDAQGFRDEEYFPSRLFQPHGVCYDRCGRIIVADPNNDSVVRLVRHPRTRQYKMEQLIARSEDGDLMRFASPSLVAMGRNADGYELLWVVCKEYVYVFKYCFEMTPDM